MYKKTSPRWDSSFQYLSVLMWKSASIYTTMGLKMQKNGHVVKKIVCTRVVEISVAQSLKFSK